MVTVINGIELSRRQYKTDIKTDLIEKVVHSILTCIYLKQRIRYDRKVIPDMFSSVYMFRFSRIVYLHILKRGKIMFTIKDNYNKKVGT